MQWCSKYVAMEIVANYLESCGSIVQTVGFHTSTFCPGALGPTTARSRRQFKTTLNHDAVAAALSHKHHPIFHVGAGPIQLVYASN